MKLSGALPRLTVAVPARCLVALVMLLVLAPSRAGADRPAARDALVAAQPILDRVALPGQTPLVLRGHVTGAGARWVREVPRELVADLAARLDLRGRPDAPVDVCVFSSSAAYRAFARAVYPDDPDISANGFYDQLAQASPYNLHTSVLETNFVTNQKYSDYYVERASFLRMDNITVGYAFNLRGQAARAFATMQNAFTITGYSGVDPTAGLNGIDNNLYPRSRTVSAGMGIQF